MSKVLRNPVVSPAGRWHADPPAPSLPPVLSPLVAADIAEVFERGRRQGISEGRRAVVEAAAETRVALEAAIAGAVATVRADLAAHTLAMLDDAMAIAEFVVATVGGPDSDDLAARIRDAITHLDDGPIVIELGPDAVIDLDDNDERISIRQNPSLGSGEARLVSRWSVAELTRDAALTAAREALT